MKIHPLHIYLGSALLAQLIFYRAVSIELGLDQLGHFSQLIAIAFVTASIMRFGCENAVGRFLVESGVSKEEQRRVGFRYILTALFRTLLITVPVFTAISLYIYGDIALLALAILFAFNFAFSFLERALGRHLVMVLLDSRATLAGLAACYYLFDFMPSSASALIGVIAAAEAAKCLVYTATMYSHFGRLDLRDPRSGIPYRSGHALNEFLSVVANYGFQIFLPFLAGATTAGTFFLLQRLANPLTFILNVANSLATARIVRDASKAWAIYLRSVKEMALLVLFAGACAIALQGPLLDFFELSDYGWEFLIVLGGVMANLLTGASGPVFNNLGRPIYSSLSSLCFIVSFFALAGVLFATSTIDLLWVAWAFLAANVLKNLIVLAGLKRLQRAGAL